jgi:hypothetical protein
MPTPGRSASQDGDRLKTHDVDPAFPQSVDYVDLGSGPAPKPGLGDGDLLIRVGFQRAGATASEDV